ncbi:MAG TPA: DUF72 domain-containing protein [Flavisolibacter sp.]|jgi:uncharacterized protein YecE (DUF72 family)|nr:DUF72 domain-containing protein [Flavisolibacter sp.]
MDFGHVPLRELDKINFTLPPEPTANSLVLSGKRADKPEVYIGCPRWGVKEWVGKLFPKGTKDTAFLDEYVKQFNCIELNATFYNIYNEAVIAKWAARAGGTDFLFLPKIFQGISHEGTLHDKSAVTHAFEKSVAAFGSHLGPCFLQLSDRFAPARKKELAAFLRSFPDGLSLFVEVRHPDWFVPAEMELLVQLLRETGKGLINTDTAGRRDCCHLHLAQPKTMVRFVANNLHTTDYRRIDEWVKRMAAWIDNGLQSLYFIIHMDQEKHSPELAAYLIDSLNAACRLSLKKPVLLQRELF